MTTSTRIAPNSNELSFLEILEVPYLINERVLLSRELSSSMSIPALHQFDLELLGELIFENYYIAADVRNFFG